MKIYITENAHVPPRLFEIEEARKLLSGGEIRETDFGWIEGGSGWLKLSEIPELKAVEPKTHEVGALLGVGIFFFPYLFGWFTLVKGHSQTARIISFIWMAVVLFALFGRDSRDLGSTTTTTTSTATSRSTPSDKLTMDKFNQLQMGMSYSQAVSIIGKSGTKNSENKFGDVRTEYYHWSCGIMCGIDLYFTNGEISQKVQIGLD